MTRSKNNIPHLSPDEEDGEIKQACFGLKPKTRETKMQTKNIMSLQYQNGKIIHQKKSKINKEGRKKVKTNKETGRVKSIMTPFR